MLQRDTTLIIFSKNARDQNDRTTNTEWAGCNQQDAHHNPYVFAHKTYKKLAIIFGFSMGKNPWLRPLISAARFCLEKLWLLNKCMDKRGKNKKIHIGMNE
uniref:Uncharacterized protein n=1 Tax=Romanomermis culicivorax TaxID=13658 RepID=A0A915HLS3_ROMCU